MSNQEIIKEKLQVAVKSSPYLMGEYADFVYAAATPKYFSSTVCLEQAVLRTMRCVLGFYAELEELYGANNSDANDLLDELGDVFFWFINFSASRQLAEPFNQELDLYDVTDRLEKWSRNPDEKAQYLNTVYSNMVKELVYALIYYVTMSDINLDSVDSLTVLLERVAQRNYEKLTAAPRIK